MMQKLCLQVAKIWHVKDEGYVIGHKEGEFEGSSTKDSISNTIQEKTGSGKTVKIAGIRNFMGESFFLGVLSENQTCLLLPFTANFW